MIRKPRLTVIGLLFSCSLLLNACGDAGGNEKQTVGIPVPAAADIVATLTPGTAGTVETIGTAVSNDLVGNVEDFFKFTASAGQVYSLELFATRCNQTGWDAANNIPRLRIYRPGSDSTLMDLYLEHDYSSDPGTFGWLWGKHDLDIPLFRAPVTGTWYISVSKDNTNFVGSDYILRLKKIMISGLLNNLPFNNSTPGTALAIADGNTVYDHYTDNIPNYFTFDSGAASSINPETVCFDVTAYRNGRFAGDTDYFDPTMRLLADRTIPPDGVPETVLADGSLVSAIDDYTFSDPHLCYQLTTSGSYWLEVTNIYGTGSSDYFLTFTSATNFRAESEGNGGSDNGSLATAESIIYGDTVLGKIGSTDLSDWYTFSATPGDLLQLQVFDKRNTYAAGGNVLVELYKPGGSVMAATGPDPVSPTQFAIKGPGAFTVRALVNPSAPANTGPQNYFVKITPQTVGSSYYYTFALKNLRAASASGSNFTVEQDNTANSNPSTAEPLDSKGYAAGSMNNAGDIDYFKFYAEQNKLVTVNVYAKAPYFTTLTSTFDKVHDLSFSISPPLSGNSSGSTLEPKITVYDSLGEITHATYTPPTGKVTAEGITTPIATLSLSFIATGNDGTPAGGAEYLLSIESQDGVNFSEATYFIEVIAD